MERKIQRAAVIGSGVMGAGIAAHLANVGIEVHLLDIVPEGLQDPRFRNQFADSAILRLAKQKPSPIYSKEALVRIKPGNLEDHLDIVHDVDWIIEAVTENLAIKQNLFKRIEPLWKSGTIVSTNTSGISINKMIEHCSSSFRKHFMGTHFFNPPRYMKLLEIIPADDTDPELVSYFCRFAERTLGKGVVLAKDTPNFIANRIGVYGLMIALEEMDRFGLSVSEADALTGPLIGRPKSATFRTLDLVGIDTFVHVADNVHHHLADSKEKEIFRVPAVLRDMVRQGRLGNKTGQGFYLKKQGKDGKEILQLDPATGEYKPAVKTRFPSLEQAKNAKSLQEKLRQIVSADDEAGKFVWNMLKRVLLYSASKIPEIAEDITAVDQAMRWGFNWELGPFETWDALGVRESVKRMEQEGEQIPSWVTQMLSAGKSSFYEKTKGKIFFYSLKGDWEEKDQSEAIISLARIKEQGKVIKKNSGASLIDLGDDVACLEFHSPNNTIAADILQMVRLSLDEVRKNYRGLVIANEGKNFCLGANLMMLLMEAQDENWFEIDQMAKEFQQVGMSMKYFEKPIVSAPFSMTLGGGVEMCLPASQVIAAAETYMGLVETGVGLIPAGAGTKEMLVRTTRAVDVDGKIDLQPFVNRVFEMIAMAKVSTSGEEAKEWGYLRSTDRISVNRDYQLYHAKQAVLGMSAAHYEPPRPKKIRVVGEPGLAVMKLGIYQLQCGGYITEHDALIAKKLAFILAGGSLPANSMVTEQYLLDLEREAFLSLCGEPKSQARMQHMLLKGKPLRN